MKSNKIEEIRKRMRENGVCWWQVAEKMKISEATLYRKIRHPLDEETIQRIQEAITSVISERG